MITGFDIICFSSDWKQDPLSKHHIMSRLSKRNRVLWVNSIGMRTPTLTVADAGRILAKLKGFLRGVEKVNENLHILSPIAVPFHRIALAAYINKLILGMQVNHYCRKFRVRSPIFWTFLPNAVKLVGSFHERLSVYYMTDDFTKFTGCPSDAMEKMENELIDRCDCVIASARELARKKRRGEKIIHVITHGVDHELFATSLAMSRDRAPADIRDIPGPVLGFYGELNDWIDVRMIAEAARKRPAWSFVLIGRVAGELGTIDYLKQIPNVHLLGRKEYRDLPAYCAAFDAALIPMKINDLTICVNPLKLREYLAAGIPVIAAPLPEIKPYADVVRFAVTADELIAAFEAIAAASGDGKPMAAALSRRVLLESWDSKVEEISAVIQGALDSAERIA